MQVVEVHGLASSGDGVGRLSDGRTVFIPWTAPGDSTRVRVTESKKRFARARVLELATPSKDRVDPRCAHFGTCGGCRLQHVSSSAQLQWKARFVEDALRRIGGLTQGLEVSVQGAPAPFQYRGRVTFTVAHRGGRIRAGLREAGRPGRVADVEVCHLADQRIQDTWSAFRERIAEPGLLRPGTVVRVTLRAVEEGVILLFTPRCPGGDSGPYETLPHVVQVWETNAGGQRRLWGEGESHERWFGRSVAVPANSFTQVNPQAGQLLLNAVVEAAGEVRGLRVVDAYAGLSLTGRELAGRGAEVTTIELDQEAAAATAEDGGVRVLQGAVEARLREALPADVVILNPPRSGLDEVVVEELERVPPARVLYVSCDPATLARDLRRMRETFAVGSIQGFDLFPQTPHVEVLVALRPLARDIGGATPLSLSEPETRST